MMEKSNFVLTRDNNSNSRLLKNGNFFTSLGDAYITKNIKPLLTEVEVSYNGETFKGLQNTSNEEVCLKDGYTTTANGRCDDLVINPSEIIIRTSGGDGWSFATYRVFSS